MLAKSTFVTTQSNGRLEFKADGDNLRIEVLSADGNAVDSAELSGEDLRALVKEFAPAKRQSKKSKAANGTAGKGKGRSAEATA